MSERIDHMKIFGDVVNLNKKVNLEFETMKGLLDVTMGHYKQEQVISSLQLTIELMAETINKLNQELEVAKKDNVKYSVKIDAGVGVGTIADAVKDMITKDMERRSLMRGK